MSTTRQGIFYQHSVSGDLPLAGGLDRLSSRFHLRPLPRQHLKRSYFDTFDGRLARCGRVLETDSVDHALRLRRLGEEAGWVQQAEPEVPDFYWELSPGPVRDQVADVVEERALLCSGRVDLTVDRYEVRDAEGKILALVESEHARSGARTPETSTLRVRPLRGYESDAQRIFECLAPRDRRNGRDADPYLRWLASLNRDPAAGALRFDVPLSPRMNAGDALRTILLHLLEQMRVNLSGVEADIDTAFLHDFRIAARRSRSLITQVRGVVPEPWLTRCRTEFSWLSDITGERRDLDVFLFEMQRGETETGSAPGALHGYLAERRTRAHERLMKAIASGRLQRFLDDWRDFLSGTVPLDAAAAEPAVDVSRRSIWRLYRRMRKQGRLALSTGEFEHLHELRKTGKKLRYLLEGCRSLYPADEARAGIKHLRGLQNALGEIIDCHVQCAFLDTASRDLGEAAGTAPEVDDVLRKMLAIRRRRGACARASMRRKYRRFAKGQNRRRFKTLFRPRT